MNEPNTPLTVSYAQNREDIIIEGFFPDVQKGFYVDVGANDPVIDSVTKIFYQKGWNGINIEPIKRLHQSLVKQRPRDINLNFGISNKSGELEFTEYEGHGLSTFSETMQEDYADQENDAVKVAERYKVKVKKLSDVLNDANVRHIHFMKIDVEGYEYEVIESNDWTKYRPELICIESNHIKNDWRPLLVKNGYSKVFFDGINDYYLAKESAQRKKHFSYPETLLWPPVIPDRVNQDIQYYKHLSSDLKLQLGNVKKQNQELELESDNLRNHLKDQQRIRNLIKGLIIAFDKTITLHLQKLARGRHYYPSIKITNQTKASPNQVLESIKIADKAALSGSPHIVAQVLTTLGSALLNTYMFFRSILYKLTRMIYRKLRKLKGGNTK